LYVLDVLFCRADYEMYAGNMGLLNDDIKILILLLTLDFVAEMSWVLFDS